MNIAFPALIITFIIIPGILFSYYYRKGFWKSPISIQSFQSEIVIGLVLSVPFHLCAIWLGKKLFNAEVKFDNLVILLTTWPSFDSTNEYYKVLSSISQYQDLISYYVLFVIICPIVIGILIHSFVRLTYLDLRYPIFRFDNEWYYILSGERKVIEEINNARTSIKRAKEIVDTNILKKEEKILTEIKENLSKIDELKKGISSQNETSENLEPEEFKKELDLISEIELRQKKSSILEDFLDNHWYFGFGPIKKYNSIKQYKSTFASKDSILTVSATVDLGDETYIYWGVIKDYYFKKGEIDKIILKGTRKIKLSSESTSKDENDPEKLLDPAKGFDNLIRNEFKGIRGDLFILDYKDIRNLNVDYVPTKETEDLLSN